jgi:hypothetical protein
LIDDEPGEFTLAKSNKKFRDEYGFGDVGFCISPPVAEEFNI